MQTKRNSLIVHYLFVLLLVIAATALMYLYVAGQVKGLVYTQIRRDMGETAEMLLRHMPSISGDPESIDRFCKHSASGSEVRLTVIGPRGVVLGDSEYPVFMMNNHADRPEYIAALRGEEKFITRYSVTLGLDLAYLALPIEQDGDVAGVFRISRSVDDIKTFIGNLHQRIVIFLLFILLVSGLYGFYFNRRMKKIFLDIAESIRRIDLGEYEKVLNIRSPFEARIAAEGIYQIARHLEASMEDVTVRNAQMEAILTNMVEPVLLLDEDLKILHINRAGLRMLALDPAGAVGKGILETFRNSALYDFVAGLRQGDAAFETSITLTKDRQLLYLQVHGTLVQAPVMELKGPMGEEKKKAAQAVLLVFNNITRIKKLEKVRRDFVANVSHELKTPITSINGFVETLLQGAVDDREEAVKFLGIIEKQGRRMNAIIDDLLSLSKLENLERRELAFEQSRVADIVSNAVQICQGTAVEKGLEIIVNCSPDIQAEVVPSLIDQALVNIIDNAVKYSEAGGTIIITCTALEDHIRIIVEDHGRGIPEKDLPRIFERFYRVDKARSRDMGGTGLGLAIAKHIVHANNGTIRVSSEVGVGTTFSIDLPGQQGG